LTDPTPADNAATATLTVTAPPVPPRPSCKTVKLAGAPLAVAKVALPALNCKIGKTTKKASKQIPKGDVISTSPGAGKTLANGTKVNLVVSSGPPKKKHKKK
ncbi:MAG TPA: PASTA domain-containing protein, partial [Solirubrobacteraceae bacterium]|nr:PASTA domain-containing protein [Solirubrobacteraceae bacterium]